ncbi:DUF2306 domain-containing protein [Parvularcula dongshanensis]|uniref:Putative membrane protein n=1 Tax=Parvularcula dongshanensis TaxID=1173995 RepID=A0A840I3L6_9PROT|nr:DUF2306 domain-containing protein [Parvularcula dongshanensis]MBB4659596.1 putative membrane protein [Parvularcula dongshanensis]
MVVAASFIGLASARYALPEAPSAPLPNYEARKVTFVTHALAGGMALMIGPWQFRGPTRSACHRFRGRAYVAAIAVAWLASLPIAVTAETGSVAALGFLCLGLAWITTTMLGFAAARRGEIAEHRRWMVRSYALAFSAVTLRLYLAGALGAGVAFSTAYPIIAWACWVPNLLLADAWLRRPGGSGARVPA